MTRERPRKLTEADILKIREMLQLGIAGGFIAAEFGVSNATISNIKLGRAWRHVRP